MGTRHNCQAKKSMKNKQIKQQIWRDGMPKPAWNHIEKSMTWSWLKTDGAKCDKNGMTALQWNDKTAEMQRAEDKKRPAGQEEVSEVRV